MLRLAHETQNMALSAEMTLRASLFREGEPGLALPGGLPRIDDQNWLAWNQILRGTAER